MGYKRGAVRDPSFLFKSLSFYNINNQQAKFDKISGHALFQWNDLNLYYDFDLFSLYCRNVDFVTLSCRFQAPQILC